MSKITFSGRKDRKKILNTIWINFSSKLQQFGIKTPDCFPGDNCLLSFDEQWNSIKQEGLNKMQQILNFIVSQTKSFNKSDFNYPKLGEKIASFEVNGFLSTEEIAPFKQLVDKCNRIGLIIALVCLVLFIVGLLIS